MNLKKLFKRKKDDKVEKKTNGVTPGIKRQTYGAGSTRTSPLVSSRDSIKLPTPIPVTSTTTQPAGPTVIPGRRETWGITQTPPHSARKAFRGSGVVPTQLATPPEALRKPVPTGPVSAQNTQPTSPTERNRRYARRLAAPTWPTPEQPNSPRGLLEVKGEEASKSTPPLRATEPPKLGFCTHKLEAACRFTNTPLCCSCKDKGRQQLSPRYVDYCWRCKDFFEKGHPQRRQAPRGISGSPAFSPLSGATSMKPSTPKPKPAAPAPTTEPKSSPKPDRDSSTDPASDDSGPDILGMLRIASALRRSRERAGTTGDSGTALDQVVEAMILAELMGTRPPPQKEGPLPPLKPPQQKEGPSPPSKPRTATGPVFKVPVIARPSEPPRKGPSPPSNPRTAAGPFFKVPVITRPSEPPAEKYSGRPTFSSVPSHFRPASPKKEGLRAGPSDDNPFRPRIPQTRPKSPEKRETYESPRPPRLKFSPINPQEERPRFKVPVVTKINSVPQPEPMFHFTAGPRSSESRNPKGLARTSGDPRPNHVQETTADSKPKSTSTPTAKDPDRIVLRERDDRFTTEQVHNARKAIQRFLKEERAVSSWNSETRRAIERSQYRIKYMMQQYFNEKGAWTPAEWSILLKMVTHLQRHGIHVGVF
ncbi:MAG: hypothetical protein M1839_005885 [Geoglossum umbratile]|nr:MAG: hypothetical protein M1839_005885 [Geoglossum umbratile]